MPAPEPQAEPLEIRGIVSRRGRAEVRIVGDLSAKAIRGLIRLLTVHAELMEEAEAEERALAAEEPSGWDEGACTITPNAPWRPEKPRERAGEEG